MSRFRYSLPEDSTPAKTGAQVYVYMPGTTTKIPDTLFADATSNVTLANPFTASGKKVVFYLAAQRKVSIGISTGSGQMHTADNVDPSAQVKTVTGMTGPGGAVSNWMPQS